MTGRQWVAAMGLVLAASGPAWAQSGRARVHKAMTARGLVSFGVVQPAASASFRAVTGTSQANDFGAGAQVTNLWKTLFAEVTFNHASVDGERVFIHLGQTVRLGIPVTIDTNTVDVLAGWRFVTRSRFTPYFSAGMTSLGYKESSSFAAAGEDVNEIGVGAVVGGGLEVRLARLLRAGGDVRYRSVPGILGKGGVSKDYGEKDAGGVAFAVRLAVGK